jgi:hypothetical protein
VTFWTRRNKEHNYLFKLPVLLDWKRSYCKDKAGGEIEAAAQQQQQQNKFVKV